MDSDWDFNWEKAAGVTCSKCGGEAFRLVGRVCNHCADKIRALAEEKIERKAAKRYWTRALRTGEIKFSDLRRM